MKKYLILLFISPALWATELNEIKGDQVSMIEHVGQVLSSLNSDRLQRSCVDQDLGARECSPVLTEYMQDREKQGLFKFFISENPRELCTGVELNDNYYTSAEKLDGFYQDYTYGMTPSFLATNKGCFDELSSLKEQNSAISYYYYAQMRLLQDGIVTLTSSAAIDKKLGRPVLGDFNCPDLGQLAPLCEELKGCSPGTKDLSNDIAETRMALDLRKNVEASEPKTDEERKQKKKMLKQISALYPWIEGKEFENSFDVENPQDDANVERALSAQFEATRKKMKERIASYKNLSGCLESRSNDCDDFHERLNKLADAPIVGTGDNERDIFGRYYQNQQSCINSQRNYRDSANDSAHEFLIGSGLTIATMGLGAIAVGSGHVIKGVATVGTLSRAQKIHRSLATFSVQNSNKIKQGAKFMNYALNGTFSAKGVRDAVAICQEDLNNLVAFNNLTGSSQEASLCPKDNQNPEFQLMSDIRSCAISALASSLDFLPAVPYGIAKYRASRPNKANDELLEESEWMMDPENMVTKKMDPKYLNEEKGLSEGLGSIPNPRQNGSVPRKTKYLETDAMREKFKVHVRGGKLYNSQGVPLNSSDEIPGIFVMDKDGSIYFHSKPDAGRFHHSSFLAGGEVLSAGQLEVKDGVVLMIDNESGHYKPTKTQFYQGLYNMLKAGVSFGKAESKIGLFPE